MKEPINNVPIADPINEAHRYVDNARELLQTNGKLDYKTKLYGDSKYVRMAGNTLWNGVLLVVDAVFQVKNNSRLHPDVNDYRNEIAKRDRKLLDLFNTAYEILHVYMGYDGILEKDTCQAGFRLANDIIDRCEAMLKKSA